MYKIEDDIAGALVSVVIIDGTIYLGQVARAASHGLYLYIGSDKNRLNLFPWSQIGRVVFVKKDE